VHLISKAKYKQRFGLSFSCRTCGRRLSKNCIGELCNGCNKEGSANPFHGKHHTNTTIDTIKSKAQAASKLLWQVPEYRNKVVAGTSKPRRAGFKREQSARMMQWYKDNPLQRKLRSEHMRKSWRDGRITPNIRVIRESAKEKRLRARLAAELAEHIVLKKTVKIGERWYMPDVIIDDRLIVEFFGNFWHANPKTYSADVIVHHHKSAAQIWAADRARLNALEQRYAVIVVWEDDYAAAPDRVIESIRKAVVKMAK
jgi:hypothetical protein